jgi:hypothetical protein
MRIIQFFIILAAVFLLSIVINYIYLKNGKIGDYSQIVITGLLTFLPFISLSNVNLKFRVCFLAYIFTGLILYMPIFFHGVNDIIRSSIFIYLIFLGIIFCRQKRKFKGAP